jgi:hypothetical protein
MLKKRSHYIHSASVLYAVKHFASNSMQVCRLCGGEVFSKLIEIFENKYTVAVDHVSKSCEVRGADGKDCEGFSLLRLDTVYFGGYKRFEGA